MPDTHASTPDGAAPAAFAPVAEVSVDPDHAVVYEFGWQSWSPSAAHAVSARAGFRPTRPELQTSYYRREKTAPSSAFQGEGLLAIEPGPGESVHVFALRDARTEVPTIRATYRRDTVEVTADGPLDHIVDDGPDGLYGALARFADRYTATVGTPVLREVPPMWASWYQYFTEFAEDDLIRNLDRMDTLDLPVGVVRLDDAFQAGVGDWLTPSEGFASLDGMVGRVLDRGRRAGIWSAPLLIGEHSQTFAEHPEWLVRDTATGEPIVAQHNWDQDCYVLDSTHPGAADYLRRVFTTYAEYGASYFMVDFMYAGAIEGIRHDDVDGITAYRDALALIRSCIGDALLQGCGAPMFPSVGLVDTMRVGTDVAPHWSAPGGEMSAPATQAAVVSTVGRAFTQGRFWINDPDCLVARPEIEHRERWADVVDRYGAVRISSDGLDRLDDWGLDTVRRLLVPARTEPFDPAQVPLDTSLFRDAPRPSQPR
ncbi:glycoside hydrolase family 36 protein [Phytoactinopolyspora endophytica]|uniref:glycoside hydrolase family 36 protein n=1 Tax=Phytoactinopolyspora endophytica TaxID=1642495 RepID=UPI00197CA0D2|nr:glycoside hydrolase family 36 protein [Phytoactinopolyspora endophytica]